MLLLVVKKVSTWAVGHDPYRPFTLLPLYLSKWGKLFLIWQFPLGHYCTQCWGKGETMISCFGVTLGFGVALPCLALPIISV